MRNPRGSWLRWSAAALALAGFVLTPVVDAAGGGARGGGGGGGGGARASASSGGGGGGARASASGGGANRAAAGSGGGARQSAQVDNSRADVRTNNVRSSSVNNVNNVNVERNVNVNVEGHGGCCHDGWDNDYHPVATAAAVGTAVAVTSAVVGSIVRSVPPNCVPVNYGGVVYQQCGSTWYQPQGSQYVVVNPPR